ncbi:methionine synthase i, cobalamin-binding domain [hydrocarbon metagenome]|uniref:Methionine synthase i, cobalamin-binding domain n=1 Tax=hydrocarbon metagenome TaxID=938273 RepID=A0A0W8FSF6_9ZZZZ
MDKVIIDEIPFSLDMNLLVNGLRLKENASAINTLSKLAADAMRIGRPKALYKITSAEYPDENSVEINKVVLHSRLLKNNLRKSDIMLPFLCTCGTELEDWSQQFTDIVQKYWVNTIQDYALGSAIKALEASVQERYHPQNLSAMNPGSLDDWPIQEQNNLFHLFGDDAVRIGVTLTEGFMMKPLKSMSGIFFASDEGFVNCQFCPLEKCPGRRAPYQKSLAHSVDHKGCDA